MAQSLSEALQQTRRLRNEEHALQAMLVQWCELAGAALWPELRLLYAIPNGGHRHISIARKLKAEGVRPGVPDLCLPVARGGFHGLYLETKIDIAEPTEGGRMKRVKTYPSAVQREWIEALQAEGYCVRVYRSFEEGRAALVEYLRAGKE